MTSASQPITKPELTRQLQAELTENILPFWIKHTVDPVNGGFYGAVTNDLRIVNDEPRSAVLYARILWTYSVAYQKFGAPEYLEMARRAYEYLSQKFWDHEFGGVYWSVDKDGRAVSDRKHFYAQGFSIYGLSEYYRASQDPQSLELAQTLFRLIEKYAHDETYGGYLECRGRQWETLVDMRLSEKDLNCYKSMNTMLHILEAYTALLRVWEDASLRTQHQRLIAVFQKHIIDPETQHFKLFFDREWNSLLAHVSYGHDIEGSWLLWEAAEMHPDSALLAEMRATALKIAQATYEQALDEDASLVYEADETGWIDIGKAWWPQAEGMVGFYNAYQLSGEKHFEQAALRLWDYIQEKLVDRQHGDWFKQLDREGIPDYSHYKTGPWDCPYHHSRACYEMLARLETK